MCLLSWRGSFRVNYEAIFFECIFARICVWFFFVILMVAFPKSNIQRCRCVIISLFVFWRFCFYCFFLFWFGSKGLLHDLSIFFYLSSCLFLKIHLERQGKSWKGNYRARRK